MIKRCKKGQSTLEYVLVLVVIFLAIIAGIAARNSPIRTGLTNFFNQLGTTMGGIIDEFKP